MGGKRIIESEMWGKSGRSPAEQREIDERKARRSRNKSRRDRRREQDEKRENYGFNDMPVVRLCTECRREQEDVVTFQEIDRFTGVASIRRDICPACQPVAFKKYENNRVVLRNVGLMDEANIPAFGTMVISRGVERRLGRQ